MTDSPRKCVLEVIVLSVDDALRAEEGGADRLEVIRAFESGGLTPPLHLVRDIQSAVGLPLRVMLREDESYGLCEIIGVEKVCCMANAVNELKVDGIVLGFLRGGRIDFELTAKVLSCAPDLKATFHHAFEDTADKHAAISELKRLPQIDRILSHGGTVPRERKVANLNEYAAVAAPEIEILAGGGVNKEVIRLVRETTGIREFHVGTAARDNGKVDVSKVKELAAALSRSYV